METTARRRGMLLIWLKCARTGASLTQLMMRRARGFSFRVTTNFAAVASAQSVAEEFAAAQVFLGKIRHGFRRPIDALLQRFPYLGAVDLSSGPAVADNQHGLRLRCSTRARICRNQLRAVKDKKHNRGQSPPVRGFNNGGQGRH
jgi:hypothetical protein